MPLTRSDLQQLADVRAAEAAALVAAGLWDGAYYLAGYAVECGLKSCILAYVERTGVIFEDKKFVEKCWTHDLKVLVDLAGLRPELDTSIAADPAFDTNWIAVKKWDEISRYRRTAESAAREMVDGVADPNHGVLTWIKRYW